MRAITTSCLLLLASACVWHRGDTVDIHDFGIYGGTPVNITEVPFMAQFVRTTSYNLTVYCGACIINKQFLLSAAHCAGYAGKIKVIVGTDKRHEGQDCEIQKVFRHPKYNSNTEDYDISVIKLKNKLLFNDKVKSIPIADLTLFPKPGNMVEAIGFGVTENGITEQLHKVNLPYVDRKKCQRELDHNFTITKHMICAGGEEGKSTCHGDSGGPVVFRNRLIALPSWGIGGCGIKDEPHVYSYVPSMRDFIDQIIKNNT